MFNLGNNSHSDTHLRRSVALLGEEATTRRRTFAKSRCQTSVLRGPRVGRMAISGNTMVALSDASKTITTTTMARTTTPAHRVSSTSSRCRRCRRRRTTTITPPVKPFLPFPRFPIFPSSSSKHMHVLLTDLFTTITVVLFPPAAAAAGWGTIGPLNTTTTCWHLPRPRSSANQKAPTLILTLPVPRPHRRGERRLVKSRARQGPPSSFKKDFNCPTPCCFCST
jgi:hypothetical protein